jgi:hypothetical protein
MNTLITRINTYMLYKTWLDSRLVRIIIIASYHLNRDKFKLNKIKSFRIALPSCGIARLRPRVPVEARVFGPCPPPPGSSLSIRR